MTGFPKPKRSFSKEILMFRRNYLILLIFLVPCQNIRCQDTIKLVKSHLLSLNIGNQKLKEEILLPKVHSGLYTGFYYLFERTNKNYYSIDFTVSYNHLKTKLETEKVTQTGQVNMKYSWGYNLLKNNLSNIHFGVTAWYNWSIEEFPVWDESRAYWGTSLSAGPFARFLFNLDNHSVWITSLNSSLLGFLSRPDYLRIYAQEEWTLSNIIKITNSHFEFALPDNIILTSIKTEYRMPVGLKGKYFWSVSGEFLYSGVAEDKSYPIRLSRFNIGIGFGCN